MAAFLGANASSSAAVGSGQARTGAPTLTITPTRIGSLIWAVGADWDNATPRTVGAAQTKVDEFLAATGDTFWVQRLTNPTTGTAPTTINDTAPTTDRWNLSAIEILPA